MFFTKKERVVCAFKENKAKEKNMNKIYLKIERYKSMYFKRFSYRQSLSSLISSRLKYSTTL